MCSVLGRFSKGHAAAAAADAEEFDQKEYAHHRRMGCSAVCARVRVLRFRVLSTTQGRLNRRGEVPAGVDRLWVGQKHMPCGEYRLGVATTSRWRRSPSSARVRV